MAPAAVTDPPADRRKEDVLDEEASTGPARPRGAGGARPRATEMFEKVGTVGFQFLEIGAGPRGVGMGEAMVARRGGHRVASTGTPRV